VVWRAGCDLGLGHSQSARVGRQSPLDQLPAVKKDTRRWSEAGGGGGGEGWPRSSLVLRGHGVQAPLASISFIFPLKHEFR
jgi:hypothetical protein